MTWSKEGLMETLASACLCVNTVPVTVSSLPLNYNVLLFDFVIILIDLFA